MTLHIVQPALPTYRVAFFRELQQELSKRGAHLRVYASPRDFLGVESVPPDGFEADLQSNLSVHLRGHAFWQGGLHVPLARADVLVINGNPRLFSNYALWLRAKLLGIPVIWWGQGWSAGSHGGRSEVRQIIMRLADVVLLYSDKEREEYISRGFAAYRTFALNNGLDIESIDRVSAEWNREKIAAFRKANGLDAYNYWCIFLGRLTRKSEIGLLIESLPAIRGDVGIIALGDGPVAREAKEAARALGVCARVRWVGAQFDENAIAPWMLSASAFVYPGTVGLSLIHAFAYGLPAVVHRDERWHMPEFAAFENSLNGLAFERGSATSLARTVNELFADGERRAAMGKRGRDLVHRTFNVKDMTRRFMEAVDGIGIEF